MSQELNEREDIKEVDEVFEDMLEDYNVPDEEINKTLTFVDEEFGDLSIDFSETDGILDVKDDVIYVEDEVFEGAIDEDNYYTIKKEVKKEDSAEPIIVTKKVKVKKVKNRNKRDKNRIIIGVMREQSFGDLLPFVQDQNITDINWNGSQLWIDDVVKGRYLSDVTLTKDFVDAFSIRVSNVVSKSFNKYTPVLEAETDELRITILHDSASATGRSISIRKTPPIKRINFADAVKNGDYCSQDIANLISNSVKAKMNIIVCGLPGVGKTELVKYLTNYIFPEDRVITIEDTLELHYSKTNPNKDCIEIKISPYLTYTDAIKTCMRLLPQWVILSEARSTEVQYLIESVSTGAKCITTLHTDDVRKIPDRILNMMEIDVSNHQTVLNQIYSFFDLAILVDKEQDETGAIKRYISQVCYFTRIDGVNDCLMVVDNKKVINTKLPDDLLSKFSKIGIDNPFEYKFIKR